MRGQSMQTRFHINKTCDGYCIEGAINLYLIDFKNIHAHTIQSWQE